PGGGPGQGSGCTTAGSDRTSSLQARRKPRGRDGADCAPWGGLIERTSFSRGPQRAFSSALGWELRRVLPDVDELRLADVAARQRELDAGIDVAVGRDVAGGVAGAPTPRCTNRIVGA